MNWRYDIIALMQFQASRGILVTVSKFWYQKVVQIMFFRKEKKQSKSIGHRQFETVLFILTGDYINCRNATF